jgi:uncharacterized protein DUF11
VGVLAAALVLPAAAHAASDLAISQAESADPVSAGALETYTVTVSNQGTELEPAANVDIFGLKPGTEKAVANPYQSATPSQGRCEIRQFGAYPDVGCDVGPLAPGASAEIAVVAQMNESMDHTAGFVSCPLSISAKGSCGYTDSDSSDNLSIVTTTVSSPPTLSGSKKIVLKGLPDGCASEDFTFKAKAKVKHVEHISAKLSGKGAHENLAKANGGKLTATVHVGQLTTAESYDIKVTAKPEGGSALHLTATFQRC